MLEATIAVGSLILGFIFGWIVQTKFGNKEMQIRLEESGKRLDDEKTRMEKIKSEMENTFKALAGDIFEDKSEKFKELNSGQINQILQPLQTKINEFQKKVESIHTENIKNAVSLKQQVVDLTTLNQKMSEDANNLTKALKGDVKAQGNWGELVLEKILERSGLREGEEFQAQSSFVGDDGKRVQPDIVVYLPDDKHLVVDSKVSIIAYTEFINSECDEERDNFSGKLVHSLKTHISDLAQKHYHSAKGINSPDFVMMFVHSEGAFSIAMQTWDNLFQYAWDKNIVIVSPTTLLATLRTVASIWLQQRQTENVLKIADESGKLYDKFVGFLGDMKEIEKGIEKAQTSYLGAMNKLKTGKGSLVTRAEKIRQLGAKTKKKIDEQLIAELEE